MTDPADPASSPAVGAEVQRELVHGWTRLSEHAYTRPVEGWVANVGLVVGNQKALLVDTSAGPDQARMLLEAVRQVTDLPLVAVNSHAHFDHVFGNAFFADPQAGGVEQIWGHTAAADWIRTHGESQRPAVAHLEPEFAAGEGPHAQILPPTHTVGVDVLELDLGGVRATLFHLGRGHTDGDLLVGVGEVVFAGDLVEQGAAPAFEGSWPRDWVTALHRLEALREQYPVVVPGHGEVVDMDFVASMRTTMEEAIRAVDSDTQDPALPYGAEQSAALISRLHEAR